MNVVKKMNLSLSKTWQSMRALSKASRSLTPPGYSFHGISDFSNTEEFKLLITLGYVDIRYTSTNCFGVRYEP